MIAPNNFSSTSRGSGLRSILLIRHGATALNSDDHTVDRIRGWTDHPLSEHGEQEALLLATKVSTNPPDVLLYSDLIRARQTANAVSYRLGIPLGHSGMEFRPWNVGMYVGANAKETVPKLARYAIHTALKTVPGGESFHAFRTRFLLGLLKALQRYQGTIGIVTHHRNERLLKAWAKLGYPENGDIDTDEFTKKGETTGHCEVINVPMGRLELYAQFIKLQHMPTFGDGREENWREWAIENL